MYHIEIALLCDTVAARPRPRWTSQLAGLDMAMMAG
jgi:hypothetical protein